MHDMQPQPRLAAGPAPEHLRDGGGGGGFPWTLAAVLAFITFNSGMAVYRSKGDAAIVAFVATSYLDLLLLLCCLWLYERAAPGSTWRDRLKASVWTLTTLLTFSFVYVVMGTGAAGLTLPVAMLVWVMAAATGVGAFTTFFDHARVYQSLDETMLPPV